MKNKTILVTSMSASMAHVVRPLEIAKVLREMGYHVVFAGSGKPARLVEQVGFVLFPLPDWNLKEVIAKLQTNAKDIHPVEQVRSWVQAELKLFDEIKPSAILDDARVTTYISTAVAGLPRISIQNAYVHRYAIRGFMDTALSGPRSIMEPGDEEPYNVVLSEYGLSPVELFSDLLGADLNLLSDVPEYAPVHTMPRSYQYVGPIIWGKDLSIPPWLKELDPEKPTIYVTMGSTGPPQAFRAIIECLDGMDYQVMMTLGSLVDQDDLGIIPSGFYVASYASGLSLARRADVIICHAGNGTAYQALLSGVPIISWPSVKDQHWNARRLSELGVSINISSASDLNTALDEIITNPCYKNEAEKFSEILKKYNGPEYSAQLIHNFMEKGEN